MAVNAVLLGGGGGSISTGLIASWLVLPAVVAWGAVMKGVGTKETERAKQRKGAVKVRESVVLKYVSALLRASHRPQPTPPPAPPEEAKAGTYVRRSSRSPAPVVNRAPKTPPPVPSTPPSSAGSPG
eukprot:CAMPEP_0174950278 /NCGR_PEP_ID=MMETSP1355-20121228/93707_1 /TAXON_ID=464990 /ORGANISM="Hemiselmis tepida, Strain CCMP443" /LENGTH=126 /DNA_ID=CAMNT_0016197879 /DNA_START=53 /DNA_END=430 /DNA_ORIENTATION=+